METVIKQTEESVSRKLTAAQKLHEDWRPLKAEVDALRRRCLGLQRLPDLHEEEGSPITPEYISLLILIMKYTVDTLYVSYVPGVLKSLFIFWSCQIKLHKWFR